MRRAIAALVLILGCSEKTAPSVEVTVSVSPQVSAAPPGPLGDRANALVVAKLSSLGLDPEPTKSVDAVTVAALYLENVLAADQAYKGKPINISGKAVRVGSDDEGAHVFLDTESADRLVRLNVEDDGISLSVAAAIRKGDFVYAVCAKGATTSGRTIAFSECSMSTLELLEDANAELKARKKP